ncbi:hypothetical protein GGP41_002585 [Bipolaris sorokiniana]|uniref:Uncharacterized protein n=1 Tax=Cochliobolus sativus TaxID=45130 RepID=A0A8H5ZJD4_COCSA|nr:hypothetical protein GGP41_002585 [Bipolaris sorokiniana]
MHLLILTLILPTHAYPKEKAPLKQSPIDDSLHTLPLRYEPIDLMCIRNYEPCDDDRTCCSLNCVCFDLAG